MPSGPAHLHEKWCALDTSLDQHGARLNSGDRAAIKFLERQGYVLTPRWTWIQPGHVMTPEESEAIYYLQVEWDFGWLEVDP